MRSGSCQGAFYFYFHCGTIYAKINLIVLCLRQGRRNGRARKPSKGYQEVFDERSVQKNNR